MSQGSTTQKHMAKITRKLFTGYYPTEIDGEKLSLIEFIEYEYLHASAADYAPSGHGDGIYSCIVCDYHLSNSDCDIHEVVTGPNPYKLGYYYADKCCCGRCAEIYQVMIDEQERRYREWLTARKRYTNCE